MNDLLTVQLAWRKGANKTIERVQQNIKTKSPTGRGPMHNTGEAADSLQYRWVTPTRLQIYSDMPGREFNYIMTLEHGRGPTKRGAKKGNPTLRESILAWIKQRNIQPEGISQKSLAYLISRKIHREGTELYRKGGNSGIISEVQSERWIKEHFIDPAREAVRDVIYQRLAEIK